MWCVEGEDVKANKPQDVAVVAEKSDEAVVAEKPSKTWVTPVESVERRAEAEGKSASRNALPAQDGEGALTFLERIGRKAKERTEEQFTNLLSHVKVPLLREAYMRLSRHASPGVDRVTWTEYGGEKLDERLADLQDRVHRGSYHPQPVRRVHIPKGDGGMRPIGIPSLEDKIVQQAARMILQEIYEPSFLGFSYGFRPGRGQHDALDAVATMITRRKVNWVLDADIRSFFDTIDHGCLRQFIEHRIGDQRLVRLLMKWLNAGVLEDGELRVVKEGTPQGGGISPLLANVYLHYAFDLWVRDWRRQHARGEVYVVRYADDFVMGFQFEQDARAFHEALASRLVQFGLQLHADKTRVIRFGRFARRDCAKEGLSGPPTFDFLGFTHICSEDQAGRFVLRRRTSRKKRRAKLARLKEEIERRKHAAMPAQHAWLSRHLDGHYRYYGVPTNYRAMTSYREAIRWMWHRALQRRSQRGRWTAEQTTRFDARFRLPTPKIHHPWPQQRFAAR